MDEAYVQMLSLLYSEISAEADQKTHCRDTLITIPVRYKSSNFNIIKTPGLRHNTDALTKHFKERKYLSNCSQDPQTSVLHSNSSSQGGL